MTWIEVVERLDGLLDQLMSKRYDIELPNPTSWLANYSYSMPTIALALYLLMILLLPRLLKNSKGFSKELQGVSKLWNLSLAVGSFCIFFAVTLGLVNRVHRYGFFNLFCNPGRRFRIEDETSGLVFWCYMFALSKYVELGDTLLLILKKPDRPVMFLHWYHHVTVLLFTWFAELWRFNAGFFFIIVNALVHTFMYYYYFLMDIGQPPKWGKILTIGQIAQMFVGIGINVYWAYYYFMLPEGEQCWCDRPILLLVSGAFMYGTYLYLFMQFYRGKYNPRAPRTSQPDAKAKAGAKAKAN